MPVYANLYKKTPEANFLLITFCHLTLVNSVLISNFVRMALYQTMLILIKDLCVTFATDHVWSFDMGDTTEERGLKVPSPHKEALDPVVWMSTGQLHCLIPEAIHIVANVGWHQIIFSRALYHVPMCFHLNIWPCVTSYSLLKGKVNTIYWSWSTYFTYIYIYI